MEIEPSVHDLSFSGQVPQSHIQISRDRAHQLLLCECVGAQSLRLFTTQCTDPPRLFCPWDYLSRQEYWSELPFPPPAHLPNSGIKHTSPALAGRFFTV